MTRIARRAYERYQAARQALARFIHASSADEIVWVRGTTEGVNLVAGAWAAIGSSCVGNLLALLFIPMRAAVQF